MKPLYNTHNPLSALFENILQDRHTMTDINY